jgi:hypothetical protein
MPSLGVGQIAKLVAALVEGDDNLLDKALSDKLEKLGEDFLMRTLGGPFGSDAVGRIGQAIDTGGMSEINRLGESWINKAVPKQSAWQSKILNLVSSTRRRIHGEHGPGSRAAWARTDWASSRDDWLDNHWRHDWRSQPRDEHGRWIPGRLGYIAITLQYRGRKMGRVKRKKMQMRRLSRARGRRAARKLFKQIRKTSTGAAR